MMCMSENWMSKEVDRNKAAYRCGYNKAIDDFSNRLYSKIKSEIDDCADELEWIDEIAKQLKAGDVD